MSQYPPPRIAKAGTPAAIIGAGTGADGPASAGSIDPTKVPSAKSAKGARKLDSLFVNIPDSPYFGS